MKKLKQEIAEIDRWFSSSRFKGIKRIHSAREVAEQSGTIRPDYAVARTAAEGFYARLRALFEQGKSITTFGPYSPGQAVSIKRAGIEGIYLGGWATSAKGSANEDPGPDLASYPLSQVPDEAAPIVRALLTADKNQRQARARMTDAQRKASPETDFRPFIIADADTGHGGDAHVRNLIRRFVEVGVPGYHIEDQKPGVKKCGHQGGKVLVSEDEQIKRLCAARFQLDIMRVPGIIVARTDAEAATLLDGRGDERDQPFILGATNTAIPTYRAAFLALLRLFRRAGLEEIGGHELYAMCEGEYAAAEAWLEASGIAALVQKAAAGAASADSALEKVFGEFIDAWQAAAGIMTYGEVVAKTIEFRASEGRDCPMTPQEWLQFSACIGFFEAREKARSMGIDVNWDCDHAKTPDGYYQVRGGIDYAVAKSLAAAPYADILWMETKTADLHDAKRFADAIHAVFPDKMLAYNLSPSFNWDTTGMNDEKMRRFPEEIGKLGFVFNFITYGGYRSTAGGRVSPPPSGRRHAAQRACSVRLDFPYKTQGLRQPGRRRAGDSGGPRRDGQGSTHHQHPTRPRCRRRLRNGSSYGASATAIEAGLASLSRTCRVRPLELAPSPEEKVANLIFADIMTAAATTSCRCP